ncbi:MAG: hypothetical protein M0P47_09285 [Bacteroidales bacterium]|nr:hypothetical protein [Bacteroidales bacterium]
MKTLKLNENRTIENIAEVAFLSENFGGVHSSESFKNENGLHINVCYDAEYINRWGWDMEETRINTTYLKKEQALKVLELRADLAEMIAAKNAI